MSHFRQKTLKSVAVLALLTAATPAVTANAGVKPLDYPGLKTQAAPTVIRSVPISAFAPEAAAPVLNQQNPEYVLKFDVADTDWTTSLQLTLSADPIGAKSRSGDIYVQFNQAEPIKIAAQARGFDARLSLDPTHVRARGNILRFFVETPNGANCLKGQSGAWALNLKASHLSLRSQAKSRNLQVADIEDYLANPLTAPKTVSLIAQSAAATHLQSLLAQAVSLRMQSAPKFTTLAGASDIEFIVGRRDQIANLVQNETVMTAKGPRLAAEDGRPMRVILTGDTDAEVLNLVQVFSEHHLPATRRTMIGTGDMILQPDFSERQRVSTGRIDLAELTPTSINTNWNPNAQMLRFDVADPKASHGEILLRLATPKAALDDTNTLSLTLNGHAIGKTILDKTRKSVAFTIPSGILRGQNNTLTANADIHAENLTGCAVQNDTANGLYFGKGSKLTVSQTGPTPLSDLSHLTATGAPFSDADGKDTLVVLPKNNADYNAALALMGTFAKSDGAGWAEAQYTRNPDDIEVLSKGRNVLFILPANEIPQQAKSNAPKSLLSALRGHSETGENLLSVEVERYASTNAQAALQTAALNTARRDQIQRGGVAALYASPYQSGKMVGVISNVPGQSFRDSLTIFTKPDHWNTIEGSVARWTEQSVLMTELSSPLPGFSRTKTATSSSLSNLGLPNFEANNFHLPEFDLSRIRYALPDIKMPDMDWVAIKTTALFWKKEAVVPSEFHALETPVGDTFSIDTQTDDAHAGDADAGDTQMSNTQAGDSDLNESLLASVLPKTDKPSAEIAPTFTGQAAIDWTQKTWVQASASVADLKIQHRLASLSQQVKPMSAQLSAQLSAQWQANLQRLSRPENIIGNWSFRQLSTAGFVLILMFGLILVCLGMSDPKSRRKKRS